MEKLIFLPIFSPIFQVLSSTLDCEGVVWGLGVWDRGAYKSLIMLKLEYLRILSKNSIIEKRFLLVCIKGIRKIFAVIFVFKNLQAIIILFIFVNESRMTSNRIKSNLPPLSYYLYSLENRV